MKAKAGPSLILLWVAFIAADTLAQLSLKLGSTAFGDADSPVEFITAVLRSPWIWLGILSYISVFFLWMGILQRMDLAKAFPITVLTFITVPFAANFLLQESLSWMQALGIAIILIGVLVLGSEK